MGGNLLQAKKTFNCNANTLEYFGAYPFWAFLYTVWPDVIKFEVFGKFIKLNLVVSLLWQFLLFFKAPGKWILGRIFNGPPK